MPGIVNGGVTVADPQKSPEAQSDGRRSPANLPAVSYGTAIKRERPNLENASRAKSENDCCW